MEFDGPSGTLQVLLALVVGFGAMGYGAYGYVEQSSALDSAVEVDATVSDTAIEQRSGRRDTDYSPVVTFEYTYEGETYTSSNVYPGPLGREFDAREAAREKLDEYEPGDTVTAYVPADSPGNAFLERERSNQPFFLIGFGALFVVGTTYSRVRQ